MFHSEAVQRRRSTAWSYIPLVGRRRTPQTPASNLDSPARQANTRSDHLLVPSHSAGLRRSGVWVVQNDLEWRSGPQSTTDVQRLLGGRAKFVKSIRQAPRNTRCVFAVNVRCQFCPSDSKATAEGSVQMARAVVSITRTYTVHGPGWARGCRALWQSAYVPQTER